MCVCVWGLQPLLLSSHRRLCASLCERRREEGTARSLCSSFPPSYLSRAMGMKKPKALPVLDLAFGRDLHPNPVGDPPKRLLGGKSPEPYSGTYGG